MKQYVEFLGKQIEYEDYFRSFDLSYNDFISISLYKKFNDKYEDNYVWTVKVSINLITEKGKTKSYELPIDFGEHRTAQEAVNEFQCTIGKYLNLFLANFGKSLAD
jgi:hypothetical protein